ncbi:MAG: hypothetical protein K2F72_05695 [Muribaculaceae bacterium]|nr:hypothetical protein [Muribaculaceae bacterium]
MENNQNITPPPVPAEQPAGETPMYGSTASGAAAATTAAEPSPDSTFLSHSRHSFWD